MITLWNFMKALPELLAIMKAVEAAIKKAEADRKLKDDLKTISEAFNSNDPSRLNALFGSK